MLGTFLRHFRNLLILLSCILVSGYATADFAVAAEAEVFTPSQVVHHPAPKNPDAAPVGIEDDDGIEDTIEASLVSLRLSLPQSSDLLAQVHESLFLLASGQTVLHLSGQPLSRESVPIRRALTSLHPSNSPPSPAVL
jgi:hypothetical protein